MDAYVPQRAYVDRLSATTRRAAQAGDSNVGSHWNGPAVDPARASADDAAREGRSDVADRA